MLICSCGADENTDENTNKNTDTGVTVSVNYIAAEGGYIEGETSQSKQVENGNEVTFTQVQAVAESGYYFVKWSDGNENITRTDTLYNSEEFTAIFEPYVKIDYMATEGGLVIGVTNQQLKISQESNTVEAIADGGYRFIGWSDGITETKRSDIANNNVVYVAMFEKINYTNLTYLSTEGGVIEGVTHQSIETGLMGNTVEAKAIQNGYYFVKWDDGVLTPKRSDIADTDKTVTAIFTNKYTVTYETTEGGRIEGKTVQELEYGKTYETVMAVADSGYAFVRWDDGSEVFLRQDTATKNVTYKAIFKEPYTVVFNCDSERGSIVGETSQIIVEGRKSNKVTAVAKDGFEFVCWSDGSTSPEIKITAYENTELYAHFSFASTGLPVISIVTETGKDVTSKTEYIGCVISLYDTETNEHFVEQIANIRGRGNSTWT